MARTDVETPQSLIPGDVEWVVEWQLATAFPWVPLGSESPVAADRFHDGRSWRVRVRAGHRAAEARLPLQELARVIRWCYGASVQDLARPPVRILASLAALRRGLRAGLNSLDPLAGMGYTATSHDSDVGT